VLCRCTACQACLEGHARGTPIATQQEAPERYPQVMDQS
jgi:hypothetical protein